MILYKFLNGDKTASAKYITDAFYDVNELKSLRQFYVTELREVSPEIVQAGVNIEVGMYNEVDFINMAKIAQLTLENGRIIHSWVRWLVYRRMKTWKLPHLPILLNTVMISSLNGLLLRMHHSMKSSCTRKRNLLITLHRH